MSYLNVNAHLKLPLSFSLTSSACFICSTRSTLFNMAIPIIEVSSVAQAASFYSSILQSLGIRYIGTSTDAQLGTSVTFGFDGQPVLQIHQFNRRPSHLRISAIALEVPSSHTIGSCLEANRLANPNGYQVDDGQPISSHATILDLDGNRLCLVTPSTPVDHMNGDSASHSVRVLGWTYDIGSPNQDCSCCGRPSIQEQNFSSAIVTDSSGAKEPIQEVSDSSGVSSSTILGALLGAAAGAALTYGLMSTDSQKSVQEPKSTVEPVDQARTVHSARSRGESSRTIKDPKPTNASTQRITFQDQTKGSMSRTTTSGRSRPRTETASIKHQAIKAPAQEPSTPSISKLSIGESKSHASKASVRPDKTETVKRIDVPASGSHRSRTSRSQASQSYATAVESTQETFVSARSQPRSVVSQARISIPPDTSSRLSSANRDTRSKVSSGRSHVSARNIPLPLSEATFKGDTISKVSHGPSHASHISARNIPLPMSEATFKGNARSKVSTAGLASHVSARNVPLRMSEVTVKSDARSKVSGSRSHVSARHVPLPLSEATFKGDTRSTVSRGPSHASHISARNVALPSSDVGSSHANWDDDRVSLAPSDSISCVGSKATRNM